MTVRCSSLAWLATIACTPAPAPASPIEAAPVESAPIEPAPIEGAGSRVRMDGFGDVMFGADVAQIEPTLAEPVPREGCHEVAPIAAGTPPPFTWLVSDGRVVRLDARSDDVIAQGGGRIGMSAVELRRAYTGKIVEEPNKYDPQGQTWIVGPTERAHFVFELDATAHVIAWRAGITPEVDWVEHCG